MKAVWRADSRVGLMAYLRVAMWVEKTAATSVDLTADQTVVLKGLLMVVTRVVWTVV